MSFYAFPFVAVLFAAFYYGQRIDSRVKLQYANLMNGDFISPSDPLPTDLEVIRKLTNNSEKVYILDNWHDFVYYYYGHYVPQGYLNPCSAFLTKNSLWVPLQNLLDSGYCIICLNHIEFDEISPFLSYNRMEELEKHIVLQKAEVTQLLKSEEHDLDHISIKNSLSPWGITHAAVSLGPEFSIQCLLKPDSVQQGLATIIDNIHATVGDRGFRLAQNDSVANTFVFKYGINTAWVTSDSFNLPPDKWSLLTVTVHSKEMKVFVNGVLVSTVAVSTPIKNSTMPLVIGNCNQHTRPFKGIIREIKISNNPNQDAAQPIPDNTI